MKIVKWSAIIALVWFLGDRLCGFILQHLTQQSEFRYAKLYNGGLKYDILVIGNSRGVNGFYQPEIEALTGKKVLNISYNGLRMDIAKALIEDYLVLNKSPQTIILEASMLTKSYPELLKEFKPFATPGTNLWNQLNQFYPKIAQSCKLSHIFRYNSELFLRSLYYYNRNDQNWINHNNISKSLIESLNNYGGTRFDVVPELVKDLNAVQKLCFRKNIKLKIVLTPYFPKYQNKMTNLEEWIAQLNKQIGNTKIADYSNVIIGKEFFADWVHLNKQGSIQFLHFLNEQHFFEK